MSNNSLSATGTAPATPTNGKSARLADKDPGTKVARQRLSVLQMASCFPSSLLLPASPNGNEGALHSCAVT
jgi:hypothetical protein